MSAQETFEQLPELSRAGEHLGQRVTAFGWVQELREGSTKDGRPYFDLRLADVGGAIACKIWGDNMRLIENARGLERGMAVKALADVREYRGAVQLTIAGLREVEQDEEIGRGHV